MWYVFFSKIGDILDVISFVYWFYASCTGCTLRISGIPLDSILIVGTFICWSCKKALWHDGFDQ